MTRQSSCRSCSEVHEENRCTCGHEYHGHGHGLDFVIGGGRCLNCRCRKYTPEGKIRRNEVPAEPEVRHPAVPVLTDEERAAGFAEVVRRLRNRTPEERVLMAADTETVIAEHRIIGEELVADLAIINAQLRERRRREAEGSDQEEQ